MANNERTIHKVIDKTRFRTFPKVKDKVLQEIPGITEEEIKDVVNKRIHDKKLSLTKQRIYQVRIFSKFRNAWFGDIYDNLADNTPRYWYIFINTNTRYAVAYPMERKTADAIKSVLIKFVNDYHPRKITHDEEAGFTAKDNLKFLKNNKCGVFIVGEHNHSTLGIIDRFMRTIRDMNTPQEYPISSQSTDKEFKYISIPKMQKILESYNNTKHTFTGHTPKEMMDNPELEDELIKKCLLEQSTQKGIKDFRLKVGDLVRYLIPRDNMKKRRYNISRESYKISEISGNIYTIVANDKTTMNLPRWRLIKVDPNENHRVGKTLETDRGIIEEVSKIDNNRNQFRVKFRMPNNQTFIKNINKQ